MTEDEFTRREVNRSLLATAVALAAPGASIAAASAETPVHLFDFAIAGGWYHGLHDVRDDLARGERLVARAEPANPHDANAVAIDRADGRMLGYVPRAANAPIARLLAEGANMSAEVIDFLNIRRDSDIPVDLVFTGFSNGDPRIRLTLVG